jgi:hypothetical protein
MNQFQNQGLEILDIHSAELFYTGHVILGSRVDLRLR